MAGFRNILLPLDMADQGNAERAIDSARMIAEASGANVHPLHVGLFLPRTYAGFVPDSFYAAEKSDCDAAMAKWREGLGLPEQRVTQTLRPEGEGVRGIRRGGEPPDRTRHYRIAPAVLRVANDGIECIGHCPGLEVSVLIIRADNDRETDFVQS